MLILKLNNERKELKKTRGIFKRKKQVIKQKEFNRYSINVNGKAVLVLELSENELGFDDVVTLLKIYKGRVLVAKENKDNKLLKEYLFEPKEYYQRAILSSLKNQIRSINREWKYITVKMDEFSPFKELFEIVKLTKKVNLITQKNAKTIKFVNDCYNEYGAIVLINGAHSEENDVLVDLENVDSNGKLMINVKGREFLLYPDNTYFQGNEEFKKLMTFGIEHNIICAAFSNK